MLSTHVGLVYTYLAGHVGHKGDQGAFTALTRGYTYWASGKMQEMEVNTSHPVYCHVHCTMKPSMGVGLYHVYLLLGQEGELCSAICECAAGYVHDDVLYFVFALSYLFMSLPNITESLQAAHMCPLFSMLLPVFSLALSASTQTFIW